MSDELPAEDILSVSDLNHSARLAIEDHFRVVWVLGELSNFARPRSGHWYFTLKDDRAQVRCAMFANRNRAIQLQPGDGQMVLIRGRVSLYEGRGEFQVIADYMEPAGEGALRQAFDKLKLKLAGEGLFESQHKLPLPAFPEHCAVVTSATGAALQDVLAVWQRRYPRMRVTIVPSLVQGAAAEEQLIRSVQRALALQPDVLLLTRGGGSLEDLWCFNSEALARTLFAADIPVVSAVGHEIDTTICDFVADVRAPTPSAGAELITPDGEELAAEFRGYARHIRHTAQRYLQHQQLRVDNTTLRLKDPQQIIDRFAQRVDDASMRLSRHVAQQHTGLQTRLANLGTRLRNVAPDKQIERRTADVQALAQRQQLALSALLQRQQQKLAQAARMLQSMSPLPTLTRGYGMVMAEDGQVVSSIAQVQPGQRLTTYLRDGSIRADIVDTDTQKLEDKF